MEEMDKYFDDVMVAEDELKTSLSRVVLRKCLRALRMTSKENVERSELWELHDDLQTIDDELDL